MHRIAQRLVALLALLLSFGLTDSAAVAASCGGELCGVPAEFAREAAAQKVSPRALAALDGVAPRPARDSARSAAGRSGRASSSSRCRASMRAWRRRSGSWRSMQRCLHASSSASACREPVIVAIWGLETDFGTGSGTRPAIPALATLAHDCRRTGMFQGELLAALRIIERGDMSAGEMRGAWAGELGQTQFLPSSYLKFAVDFDGNGRRDLIRSVPDVLASTANYLKGYGWQRGQPWTEGTQNFAVLKEWNKATVYQKTIALFATRLSQAR